MRSRFGIFLMVLGLAALMATSTSSADDHALRFGSDQRHEVDAGLVIASGDQYTVEAWIRIYTDSRIRDHGGEIVGQHADGTDAKGTLDMRYGLLRFLINTNEDEHHELLSDRPVPLGVWTHVAGVYDGAHMRLYMNAQLVGSMPVSGAITHYDKRRGTRIGGYSGTFPGDTWFSGDIDETRIWNVARSPSQLLDNMFHPISPQADLIGYWRFDEGAGSIASDVSGQGHHGTLTNYQGVGLPTWVQGVFTQIDPLARRRLAEMGPLLPTVWIDADVDAGNQGRFTIHDVEPGQTHVLQLHVEDAPQISGWNATLDMDPAMLRVVEGSFQPGDFIPNAAGRLSIDGDGRIRIAASSADAQGTGSGFLGAIAVEALQDFAGHSEVIVGEFTLDRLDQPPLREQTLSRVHLVAWPAGWPIASGDPLPLALIGPDLVAAGDTVRVPLMLNAVGSSQAVGAIKAEIRWAPDQLVLVDVSPGIFGQATVDTAQVEQGRLTISSFSTTGTRELTQVAELAFVVLGLRGGAGQVRADLEEVVATAAGDFRDLTAGVIEASWNFEIDTSAGMMGDVDRDGHLTIRDALIIAALATSSEPASLPEAISAYLADVDADGRIGIRDALIVATFVVDPGYSSPSPQMSGQQKELSLKNLHDGDQILLHVEPDGDVQGYRLELAWDPEALRLAAVHPAPEGLHASSGALQLAVMTIDATNPLTVKLESRGVLESTVVRHSSHAVRPDFTNGTVAVTSGVQSPITAVLSDAQSPSPQAPGLLDNYPNPFNSSTTIRFALPPGSDAHLRIYDLRGQLVRMLRSTSGVSVSSVTWDGRDQNGFGVASGVYLCQLVAGENAHTPRKLLLLR